MLSDDGGPADITFAWLKKEERCKGSYGKEESQPAKAEKKGGFIVNPAFRMHPGLIVQLKKSQVR